MGESANSYNSLDDNTLARLSKNGDDNAFNELAMRYLNTINFIARKYSAEGYELNDFVQEGLLALLYACRTFDENGNSGFKNYMSVVVERRFISIIRKSSTQKAVPKSALVQLEELGDTLEDFSQSPEELIMCREHLNMVFDKLKNVLSKTEFEVVMLYGNGLSYKEIAKKLSIPEKSADNALQRARRKICNINMS
ncbi:sigma-70 family RNA polymerase sigma factor [Ruminococcus sp.]|uniref:sigma-70 family RNA polymerase sigma factor n=1 Tax=Ruminococcus sp. TaxID=41978 RepID=UPI003F102FF4